MWVAAADAFIGQNFCRAGLGQRHENPFYGFCNNSHSQHTRLLDMACKMYAWKKWYIFVRKFNFEVILEIENEKITALRNFAQTTEQILDNWKAKKPHWLKRTQHPTYNSFLLCMCWREVTRVLSACFCGNCNCKHHFNFNFQSGKWHGPVCAGDLASFPGNQQYWQYFSSSSTNCHFRWDFHF